MSRPLCWLLLHALEYRCNALAHADAHRSQSIPAAPPAQFVQQRSDQPCAARAKGMAERDCTAVHVRPLGVQLEVTHARNRLRRKGFVDLDQVDLRDGQLCETKRLPR